MASRDGRILGAAVWAAAMALAGCGGPAAPAVRCQFFEPGYVWSSEGKVTRPAGAGVDATHAVYVIDTSGSMLPHFDGVLEELQASVAGLTSPQRFQVIFYARDTFVAYPPAGLACASGEAKSAFREFLKEIRSYGWGSSPVPALEAAVKNLKTIPDRPGERKVLFLLTDGGFNDVWYYKYKYRPSVDVGGWLRQANADKAVHVYPIIIGVRPAKESEEEMKTIAGENGGQYRFIDAKY